MSTEYPYPYSTATRLGKYWVSVPDDPKGAHLRVVYRDNKGDYIRLKRAKYSVKQGADKRFSVIGLREEKERKNDA